MSDHPVKPVASASWAWRWLLSYAVALCGAGIGTLYPDQVWWFVQYLAWLTHGRPARWPGHLVLDGRVGAAFVGFLIGSIVGLIALAMHIIVRDPRPRL